MDIIKVIGEQILKDAVLSKMGTSVGVEPSKVAQIIKLGMPTILQALGRNASTVEGSQALEGALKEHEKDKLSDIEKFLEKVDTRDGAKILDHVFQDKNVPVQENIAKKTGVNNLQVAGILAMIAPIVLGMLSQQKKKKKVETSNIPDLIGSMLSPDGGGNIVDMFSGLLDSDKDGNVMDDLGKLLGGLLKK